MDAANQGAKFIQLATAPSVPPSLWADVHREVIAAAASWQLRLPRRCDPRETIAVGRLTPKTAALVFDRIWWPPPLPSYVPSLMPGVQEPPEHLRFFGATDDEQWVLGAIVAIYSAEAQSGQTLHGIGDDLSFHKYDRLSQVTHPERLIADAVCAEGFAATSSFAASDSRNALYKPGAREVLLLVLNNLAVVDESQLSWEQVVQFRADKTSQVAYRRLLHWLDTHFIGKPASFIEDEIALRLHDYAKSLSRHGVRTKLGVLETLVDPSFIAAASAAFATVAFAADLGMAVVTSAALTSTKLAVSLIRSRVDLADEVARSSEIAVVHQLKDLRGAG